MWLPELVNLLRNNTTDVMFEDPANRSAELNLVYFDGSMEKNKSLPEEGFLVPRTGFPV